MARRKHSPEQVTNKLRQAELAIAEGCTGRLPESYRDFQLSVGRQA